jgi:acylpyruvate hydrolase
MRFATIRTDTGTRAVVRHGDTYADLGAADVGTFLAGERWREVAGQALERPSTTFPAGEVELAPLVPAPSKVVCVGLNYRTHILEMGRDLPTRPTLFSKYADTLIGANDDIVRPGETDAFDWEVELALVIGREVRRATGAAAEEAIAGFTVLNDITCRDWQFRTKEWLQGKNWEATTPVGPELVTPDELPGGVRPTLDLRLLVDGEVMQQDTTADLLFDPVDLVEYVSTMIRLRPGDVIATGTPGGVGHARTPARYLVGGETVVAEIDHVGRLENRVRKDESA